MLCLVERSVCYRTFSLHQSSFGYTSTASYLFSKAISHLRFRVSLEFRAFFLRLFDDILNNKDSYFPVMRHPRCLFWVLNLTNASKVRAGMITLISTGILMRNWKWAQSGQRSRR